jgi:hypothetical protein
MHAILSRPEATGTLQLPDRVDGSGGGAVAEQERAETMQYEPAPKQRSAYTQWLLA